MLKKTITYTDYNGVERTEDFYFNLSKAEIMEMNLSQTGGLEEVINRIISTKDVPKIAELFKEIIMKSYGVKSLDGKRMEKSKEISEAFVQTEAYSELFMEIISDTDAAAKFIQAVLPQVDGDKPTGNVATIPVVNS